MIIVNFAHPLSSAQLSSVAALAGEKVDHVYEVPCQLDLTQPLFPQVEGLLKQVPLSAAEWQTLPLIVNLPGLSHAAAAVLAYLHGITGYFPTCLRPVVDAVPLRFEVAEILELQTLREQARTMWSGWSKIK